MSQRANKAKTVTAVRAEIKLGNLKLWVFQLPDGEYRLSKTQILEVIEENTNWLSRLPKNSKKALEAMKNNGFTGYQIQVSVKLERGVTRAQTLSVSDAMTVWFHFAKDYNPMALDLLFNCGIETVERRADKAFGVKRSEEEYNERFALRMDLRTVKYKAFVQAVGAWERREGIYKTPEGQKWFMKGHDKMNLRLQSLKSRKIIENNKLPKGALIRDYFGASVLADYSSVSQLAANFLSKGVASNPVEAVDLACDFYLPEGYIAKPAEIKARIGLIKFQLNQAC